MLCFHTLFSDYLPFNYPFIVMTKTVSEKVMLPLAKKKKKREQSTAAGQKTQVTVDRCQKLMFLTSIGIVIKTTLRQSVSFFLRTMETMLSILKQQRNRNRNRIKLFDVFFPLKEMKNVFIIVVGIILLLGGIVQADVVPTVQPTMHTYIPTVQPSSRPSTQPSMNPSSLPSSLPSKQPTCHPTCQPSSRPSQQPSSCPSNQPSSRPSQQVIDT